MGEGRWRGGGKVLGEGGEKAEILDFFVEVGGWIIGRWRGRDDIFIDVGHFLDCTSSALVLRGGFGVAQDSFLIKSNLEYHMRNSFRS